MDRKITVYDLTDYELAVHRAHYDYVTETGIHEWTDAMTQALPEPDVVDFSLVLELGAKAAAKRAKHTALARATAAAVDAHQAGILDNEMLHWLLEGTPGDPCPGKGRQKSPGR